MTFYTFTVTEGHLQATLQPPKLSDPCATYSVCGGKGLPDSSPGHPALNDHHARSRIPQLAAKPIMMPKRVTSPSRRQLASVQAPRLQELCVMTRLMTCPLRLSGECQRCSLWLTSPRELRLEWSSHSQCSVGQCRSGTLRRAVTSCDPGLSLVKHANAQEQPSGSPIQAHEPKHWFGRPDWRPPSHLETSCKHRARCSQRSKSLRTPLSFRLQRWYPLDCHRSPCKRGNRQGQRILQCDIAYAGAVLRSPLQQTIAGSQAPVRDLQPSHRLIYWC